MGVLCRVCGDVVGSDAVCDCGCEFLMDLDVLLFCCLFMCVLYNVVCQ